MEVCNNISDAISISDASVPSHKESLTVCSPSSCRKVSWRNDTIEPWKTHLLELVNEVPKAHAVLCESTPDAVDGYSRIASQSSSRNTIVVVPPSHDSTHSNSQEFPSTASQSQLCSRTFPRIRTTSVDTRIRSLRLEIGDLSIPDNLEKLCNHYFQLESPSSSSVGEDEQTLLDGDPSDCSKSWTTGAQRSQSLSVLSQTQQHSNSSRSSSQRDSQVSSESFCFDSVFHGLLTKTETQNLLKEEGDYLVRLMNNEQSYILSFKFEDEILNYKLLYENNLTTTTTESTRTGFFYLEDRKKKYESLDNLVQDGLTTLLLDCRAGFYLDMMTELAQIKRQDSCLYLSPTSSGGSYVGSRKNSGVPAYVSLSRKNSDAQDCLRRPGGSLSVSRQVSQVQILQQDRLSKAISDYSTETECDSTEMELNQHWFVEVNLEKKSKCRSFLCIKSSRAMKLYKRALVCKDCGMTIHEQCLSNVLTDPSEDIDSKCVPQLDKIPSMFGSDLTTLVKATLNKNGRVGRSCPYGPPFVLVRCIEEIESRGILTEGLYRVSGYQDMIAEIQSTFEKDKTAIDMKAFSDINSICGVVKLFLRMLPEPLITTEVFDSVIYENEGFVTLESVKKHVKMLPAAHRITLKYLLEHLNRVAKERDQNKMSAFNLSSVFAPSMIVPQEFSLNILKLGTDIVEIMIKHTPSLFPQH